MAPQVRSCGEMRGEREEPVNRLTVFPLLALQKLRLPDGVELARPSLRMRLPSMHVGSINVDRAPANDKQSRHFLMKNTLHFVIDRPPF